MRNVNDVKLHLTLQFLGNGDKHSLLVLIDQRFNPCEHVHLDHRKAFLRKNQIWAIFDHASDITQ